MIVAKYLFFLIGGLTAFAIDSSAFIRILSKFLFLIKLLNINPLPIVNDPVCLDGIGRTQSIIFKEIGRTRLTQ